MPMCHALAVSCRVANSITITFGIYDFDRQFQITVKCVKRHYRIGRKLQHVCINAYPYWRTLAPEASIQGIDM